MCSWTIHIIYHFSNNPSIPSLFSLNILWNSMTSTSFVFTEQANTMKYGEGFLYNLVSPGDVTGVCCLLKKSMISSKYTNIWIMPSLEILTSGAVQHLYFENENIYFFKDFETFNKNMYDWEIQSELVLMLYQGLYGNYKCSEQITISLVQILTIYRWPEYFVF